MTRARDAAEKAGRAAKIASVQRKKRGRVVVAVMAALIALPALLGAVAARMEVSRLLEERDGLTAQRDQCHRSLIDLQERKTRRVRRTNIVPRARRLGLREPETGEVYWVSVSNERERG